MFLVPELDLRAVWSEVSSFGISLLNVLARQFDR